jgi:hypothetical protein
VGQVYAPRDSYFLGVYHGMIDWPFSTEDDVDRAHFLFPFVVAVPELVASSYAAIFTSRRIWRPPGPGELRSAAQTLCRLQDTASDESQVGAPAPPGTELALLARMGLVNVARGRVSVTLQGRELIGRAAGE